MTPFGTWLAEIGLGTYAAVFASNKIDFDVIRSLNNADLRKLALALGDRARQQDSVWSRQWRMDPGRWQGVPLGESDPGGICLDQLLSGDGVPGCPSGYKMSGYGRESGVQHLGEYLNVKPVWIETD
jgi:acyl-CoA reductase-like NAD-dependent aldehyde dehydrogenase